MARAKCTKCGAECCTCWGCDPKQYVNGLCPKCQREKTNDAAIKTSGVQRLQQSIPANMRNR